MKLSATGSGDDFTASGICSKPVLIGQYRPLPIANAKAAADIRLSSSRNIMPTLDGQKQPQEWWNGASGCDVRT